jgi:hypothetical protein
VRDTQQHGDSRRAGRRVCSSTSLQGSAVEAPVTMLRVVLNMARGVGQVNRYRSVAQ